MAYIKNVCIDGFDDGSKLVEIDSNEIDQFQLPGASGNKLQSDSVLGNFFELSEINVF